MRRRYINFRPICQARRLPCRPVSSNWPAATPTGHFLSGPSASTPTGHFLSGPSARHVLVRPNNTVLVSAHQLNWYSLMSRLLQLFISLAVFVNRYFSNATTDWMKTITMSMTTVKRFLVPLLFAILSNGTKILRYCQILIVKQNLQEDYLQATRPQK